MIKNAVIFAAGEGRRMGYCSKAMKMVSERPLITYGLDALRKCNIRDVIIIHRPNDNDIMKLLDGNYNKGVQIRFLEDIYLQGVVMAHKIFDGLVQYPLLTMDCDIILKAESLKKMLVECEYLLNNTEVNAAITVIENSVYENNHSVILTNNLVTAYNSTGLKNGKDAGYIYMWRESIIPFIEKYYNNVYLREQFQTFFEYYVSLNKVGSMHIDYLWDVDTPEMVEVTEKILERKPVNSVYGKYN